MLIEMLRKHFFNLSINDMAGFNHIHKKRKDSLETWAVLIEISVSC